MANLYHGGCHCGRFKVRLTTERALEDFAPRADQCGFCMRHRAAVISDPHGALLVTLPHDAPTPYRFGLGITDFHVCDRCGVFVAAIWWNGPDAFGVVNVPALEDRHRLRAAVPTSFADEDVAAREARRRINWTAARIERQPVAGCGGGPDMIRRLRLDASDSQANISPG